MSTRLALSIIVVASVAALGAVTVWAPSYLAAQGFPLDDAWIHAVYGRELARSGMLAYNPGIPATGSTAPLWSVVVAVPHLLTSGLAVVLWVKLLGFSFHALTAVVLFAALRDQDRGRDRWALAGAIVVAVHPDLVSASLSGMEVSLAALAAVSLILMARRGTVLGYAASAAIAFLIRPELAVIGVLVPLLDSGGRSRQAAARALAAGAATTLTLALFAIRNWSVSGLLLPATFYAKVGQGPGLGEALFLGFGGLLHEIPLANSPLLLAATLGISALFLRDPDRALRLAATSFISGLVFCAVSFALIAPIDASAFYHQRYVLPALPLLIGPLPLLLAEALARALPARAASMGATLVVAVFLVALARSAPPRFARLSNDARNIDDVQVALGRHLSGASPSEVVWAVDAGAVRYFGNAFVIDMLGLNTPELLGSRAQPFLDGHPPKWVEVVDSWSVLNNDAPAPLAGLVFAPTTEYTVTAFPEMGPHLLVGCAGESAPAHFGVRRRMFDLSCATTDNARLAAGR